jgi:adenine-specific DNA-methyltransferase
MARTKKTLTDEQISKMREIDAYTHDDKKRTNNPPAGMAQYDIREEPKKTYVYDPHLDPTLQWAGKAEREEFEVVTSSIHIHESIKPHKIIRAVQAIGEDYVEKQLYMFESPLQRMRRRNETIEFYKHGVDWTNRMIAGDSLVIMNSLLEKEGMAGQVQMVYIDPPYGIKYGSNFQPFVNKKEVKDKKDEDLDITPEMITAFRDTWELGIHSYLTYLRDRLKLAHGLLVDSGSVFVQISDENLHLIRNLLDEIFGVENFVCQITVQKAPYATSNTLPSVADYICWYAKDISKIKYRQLFKAKSDLGSLDLYRYALSADGKSYRTLTKEELETGVLPQGERQYRLTSLISPGGSQTKTPFTFEGREFLPPVGSHWKATVPGLENAAKANRIQSGPNSVQFRSFINDFPVSITHNIWTDTGSVAANKIYAVQTNPTIIQRCMLMSTDPGDLVLDITCGSGTTAFVAEQLGRRWITCDTSRVAIALAKKRLMTSSYDYYKLAHENEGVGAGFVYKTVPHITLGTIAYNEEPIKEPLYDQPEVDKTKIRISGPFTVEALPAPVVKPLDDADVMEMADIGAKQSDWREQLRFTGILGKNGARIEFVRVETMSGTKFLQADAETKTGERAVICFASETRPMDSRMVSMALSEAEDLRPTPKFIIFAAFQFDPEAAKDINDTQWPGITVLQVQMNSDLMTADLKKKQTGSQSFFLVGQPDVELIPTKKKDEYFVRVKGFDYYDVKNGTVDSGGTNQIAMWMLDTDYDGMSIEPMQVFFPMSDKNDGWGRLARTLRAEINQDLIEKYAGNESLPFTVKAPAKIAVKIVDDRGIESLKVIKIGE